MQPSRISLKNKCSHYKHELINFARREGIDWVLAMSDDRSHDVEVGNMELSARYSAARHERERVAANVRARQMLVASVDSERDRCILFRVPSPAAVWRELRESCGPKTNEARVARLKTYDHMRISVRDDPIHELIEIEDAAG